MTQDARRTELNNDLQRAVDAVYDAHAAHPSRRISITNHPRYGHLHALTSAKIIAGVHHRHEGNWPSGSCNAELLHLDRLIHQYEAIFPTRKRSPDTRISHLVGSILTLPARLRHRGDPAG